MIKGLKKPVRAFGEEVDCHRFLSQKPEIIQQAITATDQLGCAGGHGDAHCKVELEDLLERIQSCLSDTDDFQQAIRSAHYCSPRSDQPWHYASLIDTAQLRVGLLTMFRFSAIPLHDHPGSCGVQRLLSGKVRVRYYAFDSGENKDRRLVTLNRIAVTEYQKGESACFHQQSVNLHEISSISAKSILLSLMVRPYEEPDRSWYFPVSPFSENTQGLFTRVRKPKAIKLGRNDKSSAET